MAAKRKDWAELLGGPSKTGNGTPDSDGHAEPPVTVFMHTIVGNPDNPRTETDYSDDDPEFRELKASMKEIGQLQPLAVVSRPVFEQAKPAAVDQAPKDTRALLLDADWVVVTGNRRLAAARQLGWTRIDIRVQDHLGDEDGLIDEAVIIENIHRKNLAPIKEAEFLRGMVERHGSQDKVAERIGKSQMYVSHRLALLKLAPDIRKEVDAGTVKLKDARQLAGQTQDPEEQRARVQELKQKAAAPKPPRPVRRAAAQPVQNPVLKPDTTGNGGAPAADVQNPVLKTPSGDPDPQPDQTVPEPRADAMAPNGAAPAGDRQPPTLPYEDGPFIGRHLAVKMDDDPFFVMLAVLLTKARERDAGRLAYVMGSMDGDHA